MPNVTQEDAIKVYLQNAENHNHNPDDEEKKKARLREIENAKRDAARITKNADEINQFGELEY